MIIKMIPQGRTQNKIWYEIEHQKIIATQNGKTDIFDFTDMPDGLLELEDWDGNSLVETTLDEIPIYYAKKEEGILYVEIWFTMDPDEQDGRLLFPKPLTLDEFNELMDELAERDKEEEELNSGLEEEVLDEKAMEEDDESGKNGLEE